MTDILVKTSKSAEGILEGFTKFCKMSEKQKVSCIDFLRECPFSEREIISALF